MSLFLQFRRVANIYFLVTAVLQSIPQISPLNPFSAIAPLCFVLAVSMIREGVEDYLRWKSDREFNSTHTQIYLEGRWRDMTFKDVKVGDLVKVQKNEFFPCDLIVMHSSKENGIAFIETSSLDGEKNLKTKQAKLDTLPYFDKVEQIEFFASLVCDHPNPKISEFNGNMVVTGNHKISLDAKQILLCGASLRNTDWAIGIAVYTGRDTKLRQNLMGRRFKQSRIEHKVNRYIVYILILQAVLCFIAACLGGVWVNDNYDDHWYLGDSPFAAPLTGFLLYLTYFLLLNTMIPISLIISLEVIKIAQAFYMINDINMFSELRNRPCKVSDSTLNEELGQIQHIFTDKTGTLTCNRMEFKFVSIADRRFGDRRDIMDRSFSRQASHTDNVVRYAFDDTELRGAMRSKERIEDVRNESGDGVVTFNKLGQLVGMFMQAMAVCHELLVEFDEAGYAKYNGNSPDEITLVDAARRIGVKYLGVDKDRVRIIFEEKDLPEKTLLEGITTDFKLLAMLEFNSDRKRSSIILKDENGMIWLFMKGADSSVFPLLSSNNVESYTDKIKADLDSFANEGFRTLVYACKYISQDDFDEWRETHEAALSDISNRAKLVAESAKLIEKDLTLLGCTAYEDKLQDEVPETIADLRQANIKIWMLTGDKLGTAISIGKSCRLLEENMLIIKCRELPVEACNQRFIAIQKMIEDNFTDHSNTKSVGLCIEGKSMDYIFYDHDDPEKREKYPEIAKNQALVKLTAEMREIFVDFAEKCHSVICCRATPMQKQEIVRLMKRRFKTVTLSIGDGANDVPMILEAHIGIGLYGEEGMQAVQASDYAIGEFRFLWDLVLAHGHWNYIRQSEMILYFFYKNFLFTFCQFLYCFFCASSGRTVHDDWYISFYNLFFTALPLLVRALHETDYKLPRRGDAEKANIRRMFPSLYAVGQLDQIFTLSAFIWWIMKGFVHAVMVFFITYSALTSGILTTDGRNTDLVSFSVIEFTCIVFVVNLEIALYTRTWNYWLLVSIWIFSIGIYIVFMFIYDLFILTLFYSSIDEVANSPYLYLCILLCICISLTTTGAYRVFTWIKQLDSENDRSKLYG
jgi:phospholipid-transporting ATPase